jgi:hypothetical protein
MGRTNLYHPVCTVSIGNSTTDSVCAVQAGATFRCTRAFDTRDMTHASDTGAWVLDEAQPYFIDLGLVRGLVKFFGQGTRVNEFGAGKGCYTDALIASGVRVRAFEGAANVESLTRGLVRRADLTTRLQLGHCERLTHSALFGRFMHHRCTVCATGARSGSSAWR